MSSLDGIRMASEWPAEVLRGAAGTAYPAHTAFLVVQHDGDGYFPMEAGGAHNTSPEVFQVSRPLISPLSKKRAALGSRGAQAHVGRVCDDADSGSGAAVDLSSLDAAEYAEECAAACFADPACTSFNLVSYAPSALRCVRRPPPTAGRRVRPGGAPPCAASRRSDSSSGGSGGGAEAAAAAAQRARCPTGARSRASRLS